MGLENYEVLQAQSYNQMVKRHGKFRYHTNRAFKHEKLKVNKIKRNGPLKDLTEKYLHEDY